jgi:hypothetical protein
LAVSDQPSAVRACEEIDLTSRNAAQRELRPPENPTLTATREGEAPAEPTEELERFDFFTASQLESTLGEAVRIRGPGG